MAKETKTRGVNLDLMEDTVGMVTGKSYILAIGIDSYKSWGTLYNAVKDVKEFVKILTDRYQFKKENAKLLLNKKATRQNIFLEFKNLKRLIKEEDNLVIYFSGHGFFDEDWGDGFWVPFEARNGKESHVEFISNKSIVSVIKGIKSKHTFLIVDSCFSGSLFSNTRSLEISKLEKNLSRWALTSGRNELVGDGVPGEGSPFSYYLLYFLKKNTEERFWVSDLIQSVKKAVAHNALQMPLGYPLQDAGDMGGEFAFKLDTDLENKKHRNFNKAQSLQSDKEAEKSTFPALHESITVYPLGSPSNEITSGLQDKKERWLWNNISKIALILGLLAFFGGIIIGIQPPKPSFEKYFYGQILDNNNHPYRTVRIDSLIWMADDMNYDIAQDTLLKVPSCVLDSVRFYSWDAADIACSSLGKGWRLPYVEELNYLINEKYHGKEKAYLQFNPKSRYKMGLKLNFNGFIHIDGEHASCGFIGMYWAAEKTSRNLTTRNVYSINLIEQKVDLAKENKNMKLSCRCVKNAF